MSDKKTLPAVKNEMIAALNPSEDDKTVLDFIAAGETEFDVSDLVRVKTPSGGTVTWMVPGPNGEETATKELEGVLLSFRKSAVLWPSKQIAKGTQPVMRADDDLSVAHQVGDIPDWMLEEPYCIDQYRLSQDPSHADYRKFDITEEGGFPFTQWGSGMDQHGNPTKGKFMQEQRVLFLLPLGELFPIYVIAQAGSIGDIDKWYKDNLIAHRCPPHRWLVGLSLAKDTNAGGIDFSKIVPRVKGFLEKDDAEGLLKIWGSTTLDRKRLEAQKETAKLTA